MLCLLNREVVEQHRSDVLSEDCFELFQRVELDRAGNSGVAAPTAAAGAPQTHLPRGDRIVPAFGFGDQFEVLDLPGPRRLADPQAPQRMAGVDGLPRPHRPGHHARPSERRTARRRPAMRGRTCPHHSGLVATLKTLVEQIDMLSDQIAEQLATHADAHIFTSLPRSGTVRAAPG